MDADLKRAASRYKTTGAIAATVGGTAVVIGRYNLLDWPGASIAMGAPVACWGLWAALTIVRIENDR